MIPSGGVKPVAPPWLSSSLRSMYQSTPNWDTPKSCSRVPRVHSAAVCWYSPTPMRLPASSRASPMPESVWTYSAMCMKRRDGNTGMATMSWPRDLAMSREDMDISATSNSPNLSWRQKVSDGCEWVHTRSTPSTGMVPSRSGATRSYVPEIRLSSSFFMVGRVVTIQIPLPLGEDG